METRYAIDIELAARGDLAGAMDKAGSGVDRLQARLEGLSSAVRAVEGRFSSAMGIVRGGLEMYAASAISTGIDKVKEGVLGLNKEAQTMNISLASVLYSQGQTPTIEAGMERAAGWMRQMRKDAKDLPGELEDLQYIVQSAAGSAFNSGLGIEQFEKLASQSMAAAKALSVASDQAGRELAQLLEGRAGAHNVFGTRLGIHADDFNKNTPEERVKKITEALQKFEPSIKVFGGSYDAMSSTLQDNIKQFTQTATAPLFSKVVESLGEINAWFDKNQDKVKWYAEKIGYNLGQAFDWVKDKALEWWPVVSDFATKAYDVLSTKFFDLWYAAEPTVKALFGYLKDFMKDPQAFDKIESILKLYLATKGVSLGLDVANGIGGALGSNGILGKVGGLLKGGGGLLGGAGLAQLGSGAAAAEGTAVAAGTGAAATGAAATGETAAAAELAAAVKEASLLGKAGTMAEGAGAAVGAAGASLTALIGGLAAAIVGAIGAAGYEIYTAQTRASMVDAEGGSAYGREAGALAMRDQDIQRGIEAGSAYADEMDKLTADVSRDYGQTADDLRGVGLSQRVVTVHGFEAAQALGVVGDSATLMATGMGQAAEAAETLDRVMRDLSAAGDYAAISLINAGIMAKQQEKLNKAANDEIISDASNRLSLSIAGDVLKSTKTTAKDDKKKEAGVKGKGGTTIHKVEITVSSNQAPGQVARLVAKELVDMKRFRTSSPMTRNYTLGRGSGY